MNSDSDSRRTFVKKSMVVGIAAAQPAFFAGLVRAQGGGGGSSSTPKATTTAHSTQPETTQPPE